MKTSIVLLAVRRSLVVAVIAVGMAVAVSPTLASAAAFEPCGSDMCRTTSQMAAGPTDSHGCGSDLCLSLTSAQFGVAAARAGCGSDGC